MTEPTAPSWIAPIVWIGVALLVTCFGIAGVGLAIADSESAGMTATMLAAFPLTFVWGGAIGALITQLAWRKTSSGIRIGAPFGCGCLGGLAGGALAFVFFAAIFPAL